MKGRPKKSGGALARGLARSRAASGVRAVREHGRQHQLEAHDDHRQPGKLAPGASILAPEVSHPHVVSSSSRPAVAPRDRL
jgi:hypothetical protein